MVAYPILIDRLSPMVEFDKLKRQQGVVIKVTGRKMCGQKLFIKIEDRIYKYDACLRERERRGLMGKYVTVWSQQKIGFFV